jgi:hypothetical protein
VTEPGDKRVIAVSQGGSLTKETQDFVQSPGAALVKHDSKLVRRGLDELSNLLDSQWWLIERHYPLALLVDDGPGILEPIAIIEQVLTTNGYEVHSTSSEQAIELARSLHPHVAILRQITKRPDEMQFHTELSKHAQIIISATEEFEIPFEPFDMLSFPLEERELLKKTSSCVCESEWKRRQVAGVLSNTANRIIDSAHNVASALDNEIARSERYGYECSVVNLQVDQNWHEQRGDLLLRGLRDLPRLLNEQIKSFCGSYLVFPDAVYRENHFTILMPQTSLIAVERFADKLHDMIHGTNWEQLVGSSVKLSGAIWAVTYPQEGASAGDLLERIWFGPLRRLREI